MEQELPGLFYEGGVEALEVISTADEVLRLVVKENGSGSALGKFPHVAHADEPLHRFSQSLFSVLARVNAVLRSEELGDRCVSEEQEAQTGARLL